MSEVVTVTAEQAGTYRQIVEKLRVQRGPGKPDTTSVRPRNQKTGRWLDSDQDPTLIVLHKGDQADIEFLVRIGALAPGPLPPAKAEKDDERDKDDASKSKAKG